MATQISVTRTRAKIKKLLHGFSVSPDALKGLTGIARPKNLNAWIRKLDIFEDRIARKKAELEALYEKRDAFIADKILPRLNLTVDVARARLRRDPTTAANYL